MRSWPVSSDRPVADAETVTLAWWGPELDARDWDHLLDDVERRRGAAFRDVTGMRRFMAGAVLVRALVARLDGVADPASIRVDRTCERCGEPHGRPRLPGRTIEVSVSHGGDLVVVAASTVGPVGVDVEPVGELDHGVTEVATHESERAAITDGRGFTTVWSRKEAVLKALGTGLMTDPATLVVSGPTEPAAVVSLAGDPLTCRLLDLDADRVGPSHVGALAVLTAAPFDVVHLDATDLLGRAR